MAMANSISLSMNVSITDNLILIDRVYSNYIIRRRRIRFVPVKLFRQIKRVSISS